MGKFVTRTAKNGQFSFVLKASNGQVILTSEMYTTAASRDKGIESVKANAGNDARYERKNSSNGKHYFVLKAGNHQVIGNSQMYESAASMEKGIESVKKNATEALVEVEA